MDLNPANPFGDLMSKAVKLKGHQQAQLRTRFDSWPQYFQHSMFMQESVTSVRGKSFQERIEAAESMKAAGNNHYGAGDLEEAVAEYEKALAVFKYAENMDPGWKKKGIEDKDIRTVDYKCDDQQDQARLDALKISCYLNIAVCKFKLREFQTCIRACDDTLQIDPSNVKALYRRAQALITPASSGALEFEQALVNLQTAVNIDPENREVRKLYRELREQKAKQRQFDRETFTGMFDRGQVYDDTETREPEQPIPQDDEQAREKRFEEEVAEAMNLARLCEAKGETKHAQEIRDKVEATKQARMRRRKEVDFFHPTPEMIEDAKKQGIDLTDPQVQAMLHQLQEDERVKEKNPNYQPPDRSDPKAIENSTVDEVLQSMTNEQIAQMLRREGIDYQKIADREQFLETARQVLASKFDSTGSTKKNSYFWSVFAFAMAWACMRLYSTGGLGILWRGSSRLLMGTDDQVNPPGFQDSQDLFDDY